MAIRFDGFVTMKQVTTRRMAMVAAVVTAGVLILTMLEQGYYQLAIQWWNIALAGKIIIDRSVLIVTRSCFPLVERSKESKIDVNFKKICPSTVRMVSRNQFSFDFFGAPSFRLLDVLLFACQKIANTTHHLYSPKSFRGNDNDTTA